MAGTAVCQFATRFAALPHWTGPLSDVRLAIPLSMLFSCGFRGGFEVVSLRIRCSGNRPRQTLIGTDRAIPMPGTLR